MPFKEKGVLVTSSELLFTLFCCFTQSLLGTQKIASICKKTSLHWVRLGVNYCLEIQEGDCNPSRQDISTCRSVSVIRDPLWHVMVENQRKVSALSPRFSRTVRPEEHRCPVAVPPKNAQTLTCEDEMSDPWCHHSDGTSAYFIGFSPSWNGLGLHLPLSQAEHGREAIGFTSALSHSLAWVAWIWLWL